MDGWVALTVLAGYLLGSIDFGVIIPRLRGVDIYASGSGNPGASNVLRVMGRGTAAAVMIGDLLKGLAAAALGDALGTEALGFAAGGAAAAGHCFPVWHRFRGGKGVATSAGMTIWMEPLLGLLLLGIWALVVLVTRRASVASLLLLVAYVPSLAVLGHRGWSLAWAGCVALLVLVRHRANIRRLVSGSEHTVEGAGP
jgi:glycerol-3-phosphate acyltransferase PlsY